MSDGATIMTVLLLYLAIVVSPGPNFALISRLALRGEDHAAWGATLGLALAATLYAVLAMLGLSATLQKVGWLTRAVQIGGGLYLIWLGIQAWRHAGLTQFEAPSEQTQAQSGRRGAALRGVRIGAVVNLSNPKGIAFFVSLYAVAITPGTALWAKLTILCASFAIEIIWYGFVILVLSTRPAQRIYKQSGALLERVTGSVLIIFGARLATERS